jgi:hypothetical protein
MAKADGYDDLLVAMLINPLPAPARMDLLLDERFCADLGIKPKLFYPLGRDQSVETVSLHNALRAALAGRKSARLILKDGRNVRVKLAVQRGGKASFILKNEGFAFTHADLLSADHPKRLKALKRVFNAQPLLADEEASWLAIAAERPFTDREYDDVMTSLGATPEALVAELQKPQQLDSDNLMPDSPSYYEGLVAQLGESGNLEDYIGGELSAARTSLISRSPQRALRRIAVSALWQPLIPFDLLASLGTTDLAPLLGAEDPFSLLFGFELCRALLPSDAAFVELGAAFLDELFGDAKASEERFEVFSACAIISTVGLRRSAKASTTPVFWTRLAALAHAGILADALTGMPEPKGFLRWASQHFLPEYTWQCVVDRREAPRWKPEWVSPDHIFAELLGRARGALYLLPEEARPKSWVAALDSATARLSENGNLLAAVFPGPFDDFRENQSGLLLSEAFAEVEAQLEAATRFADVPGFAAMAFAMQPSEKATANVLRILNLLIEEPVSNAEKELGHLQIGAHFALATRSEPIARAVINRCFMVGQNGPELGLVTNLFAVIVDSCAVHGVGPKYRKVVGDEAARMCFMVDDAETLSSLVRIFDVLGQRDERLIPALAKARAVAEFKIGHK